MEERRGKRTVGWDSGILGAFVLIALSVGITILSRDELRSRFSFFGLDEALGITTRSHCSSERNASSTLKTFATAQADFRANDRGGAHQEVFFRDDVAGLFALIPEGGTPVNRIKLIELSAALADDRPKTRMDEGLGPRQPKAGYWFRAILKKGEPPVDPTSQFAFSAFPARYPKSGRWTYVIDEGNTVYKSDLGHGRGVEVFPDPDELRRSWLKMD